MLLALVTPAQAAFPGANGKIASQQWEPSCNYRIATMNPDGTGVTAITSGTRDDAPAWSADGERIAFQRIAPNVGCGGTSEGNEIWVMNADGTGQTRLTNNAVFDGAPAWSPDGTKIAFMRGGSIWVMNSDGSGQTDTGQPGRLPAWSPDGQKIAFDSARTGHFSIYTMNPDGTGLTRLTMFLCGTQCYEDTAPNWSPDGQKIAFIRAYIQDTEPVFDGIAVMNANGSNPQFISAQNDADPAWSPDGKKIASRNIDGLMVRNANGSNPTLLLLDDGSTPDWQPLPTRSYAHPQSASPLSVSLVRAFRQCGIQANPPDGQHSPPLDTQSCLPPAVGSNVAHLGADSQGSASFTAVPGDSDATNGDQADLTLSALLSDIEDSTGADYLPNPSGPDMTEITRLRLTDKANNYGGASGTTTESDFRVPIQCQATPDPALGSSCAANTSADALLPGFITEQRQTVIQAFRVRVDDAGANGVPGDFDDRIFATQGVYIP